LTIWLFGFNPIALAVVPLAFGFLELVVAYLWGRLLSGPRAGVIAALLVSALPVCVGESRHIKADQPAATLLYGAVLVAVTGLGARNSNAGILRGVLAGLLAYCACLIKETTVFPLAALAAISVPAFAGVKGLRPTFFGAALAFALSGITEAIVYWKISGDPLYRLHEIARNSVVCRSGFFTAESAIYGWKDTTYTSALIERLFVTGPRMLLGAIPALGVPLAAFAVSAFTVSPSSCGRVPPRVRYASFFLVLLIVTFNFATTAIDTYRPIPPVLSYFYPIILPSTVLVGVAAARLCSGFARSPRVVYFAVAAFVAASCAASGLRSLRDTVASRELDSIAELLRSTESKCLTDPRTAFELAQRVCGSPLLCERIEAWDPAAGFPAGCLVLIRRETIDDLSHRYSYCAPDVEGLNSTCRIVASGRTFKLLACDGAIDAPAVAERLDLDFTRFAATPNRLYEVGQLQRVSPSAPRLIAGCALPEHSDRSDFVHRDASASPPSAAQAPAASICAPSCTP
jgi:hypothetical protein